MSDPRPAPEYTLKLLAERYGFNRVRSAAPDTVIVDMPLESGGMFIAVLTSEQAEYLARHPLQAEDLKDKRKLPGDWPRS